MAGNDNLHKSRAGKTDEFYTQLSTIEDELRHYRHYFRDKVVFCNADDPAVGEDGRDHLGDGQGGYTSNFFRYFQLNFYQLGIRRLITTHYVPEGTSYRFDIVSTDQGGQIGLPDYVRTPLEGNGDFRSPECLALLDECDIVVTNPPFSLMGEYLPLIVNSGKQFLILGNMNHITMKELFHYFKDGKVWLGYNSGHFWFRVPDYYEEKKTDFKIDDDGNKWRRMGNICWFTDMDIPKRHERIDLYEHYTPERFPRFDDFMGINVDRTAQIPYDYDGLIGVPISYIGYHCPEQFEIVGLDDPDQWLGHGPLLNGKVKYRRLLIRPIKQGSGNDNV